MYPKHMVCAVILGTDGVSGVQGHLALGFRFPSGVSFTGFILGASIGPPTSLYLRECGTSYLVNSGGIGDSFNPQGNAIR